MQFVNACYLELLVELFGPFDKEKLITKTEFHELSKTICRIRFLYLLIFIYLST